MKLNRANDCFFCSYRSWSVRSRWISMDVLFHCNVNGIPGSVVIVYCICLGSRFCAVLVKLRGSHIMSPSRKTKHTLKNPILHSTRRPTSIFLPDTSLTLVFHKNTHSLPPIKSNSFTIFKWLTLLEYKVRSGMALLNCNYVIQIRKISNWKQYSIFPSLSLCLCHFSEGAILKKESCERTASLSVILQLTN